MTTDPYCHIISFIVFIKIIFNNKNNIDNIDLNNYYYVNINNVIKNCENYKHWLKDNQLYSVCN